MIDTILRRGLPAALAAARLARRRVEQLARRNPHLSPWQLLTRIRDELAKTEPEIARAISTATLTAWVDAARKPARDAAPVTTSPPQLPPPTPPTTFDQPDPAGWRRPAVEAGVRDLMSRQIVTPDDYRRLTDSAKSAAVTVAKVLTADAVESVRVAVAKTVDEGMTLRQFRAEVAPAMAGSGLSDSQVETVFRTSVGQAQGAGLRSVLDHPAVSEEFPLVAYHAVHDARTGDIVKGLELPTHLMMERLGLQGTNIYWADDPVIRKFWPPWRWNCRCYLRPVSLEDGAEAGIREARYWLRHGYPPAVRTFVQHPPFDLPRGWPRNDGLIRSVV